MVVSRRCNGFARGLNVSNGSFANVIADEDELRGPSANVRVGSRLCENSGRKSIGATIESVISDA